MIFRKNKQDRKQKAVSKELLNAVENYIRLHFAGSGRKLSVPLSDKNSAAAPGDGCPRPDSEFSAGAEHPETFPTPVQADTAPTSPVQPDAAPHTLFQTASAPRVPSADFPPRPPFRANALPGSPAASEMQTQTAHSFDPRFGDGAPAPAVPGRKLEDLLSQMDETFSQMLLRLIDERGLKDSFVYRKANIDRRLFSKIRNDVRYNPTKRTVLSFAVALELSLDETRDLLNKAGYSLSNSSRFDVILSFFFENRRYDMFEINEVLMEYGEPLLSE